MHIYYIRLPVKVNTREDCLKEGYSPELRLKVSLRLALGILFRYRFALIIELLTAGQTDFHLDKASLEINLERHYGIPGHLGFSDQLPDFRSMQKELPFPQGIPVKNITLFIGIHMHTIDEKLAVLKAAVSLLDAALPHSETLYFCSEKLYPGLVRLLDKVIMISLFIIGDETGIRFCHC